MACRNSGEVRKNTPQSILQPNSGKDQTLTTGRYLDLRYIRVPGRVNILGAAADLWGGRCLSFGMRRGLAAVLVVRRRHDGSIRVWDLSTGRRTRKYTPALREWFEVAREAIERTDGECDRATPFGLLYGRLPVEERMGSSGALAMIAVSSVSSGEISMKVDLARKVERNVLNRADVTMGVMDYVVPFRVRRGYATLVNLVSPYACTWVKVPPSWRFYLVRSVSGPGRLEDTPMGGSGIRPFPSLEGLRLAAREGDVATRALLRHAEGENERVHAAFEALQLRDLDGLGRLMDQSHESMRLFTGQQKESWQEEWRSSWRDRPGVVGARLLGSGSGAPLLLLSRRRPALVGLERLRARGHAAVIVLKRP